MNHTARRVSFTHPIGEGKQWMRRNSTTYFKTQRTYLVSRRQERSAGIEEARALVIADIGVQHSWSPSHKKVTYQKVSAASERTDKNEQKRTAVV